MLRTRVVTLEEFVVRYPPHLPRRQLANEDEGRLLSPVDGVIVIGQPSEASVSKRAHPRDPDAGVPRNEYPSDSRTRSREPGA